MEHFHFLRPSWLLLIPLLGWLSYRASQRHTDGGVWRKVCDPALLERLLIGTTQRRSKLPWWLLATALLLAAIALAGPVWQQLTQPMYRQQQALIVLLDLSNSMLADDIKPNRLTRAKEKLTDLLRQRHEGQTALIVYAAEPFTITPLTNDTRTILQQLPVLNPALMPAQGSRLDKALELALTMFRHSGVAHGDVLVLSDGAEAANAAARQLRSHGHRVSVLAIGTTNGAPIPSSSGLMTDHAGNIVLAKVDLAAMRKLAKDGGGVFDTLRLDDSDLHRLQSLMGSKHQIGKQSQQALGNQWREEAPWLLILLLPLAALGFRRGWLLLIPLLLLLTPHPASAGTWENLWHNHNQQGASLWQNKAYAKAAKQFQNPAWQGAAQYRAGNYPAALKAMTNDNSADGWYNRGNTLAKVGKLDQAIKAYDQALQQDPKQKDARFNRDLVRKLRQKKQQKKKPKHGSKKTKGKNQRNHASHQQTDPNKQGAKSQQKPPPKNGQQPQHAKPQSTAPKKSSKNGKPPQNTPTSSTKKRSGDKANRAPQPAAKPSAANKKKPSSSQQPQARKPQDHGKQERQQAQQQWLRRIPDDPGGLLRRKFLYQYRQQGAASNEKNPW
ncbi:MAG: VWA domain-containing protein [Mariprofundales bacterium]|nr:VWA domain-containing protein [Mariprofundales bacterium]